MKRTVSDCGGGWCERSDRGAGATGRGLLRALRDGVYTETQWPAGAASVELGGEYSRQWGQETAPPDRAY